MGEIDKEDLEAVINHLFLPPQLPQAAPSETQEAKANILLSGIVLQHSESYASLSSTGQAFWHPILQMLRHLSDTCKTTLSKASIQSDFCQMKVDGMCSYQASLLSIDKYPIATDILVYHIRAQNACVIVRMLSDETIFEIFEVSPRNESVMSTEGKLRCSYPLHAVAIPESVFSDDSFRTELASFLAQMDQDEFYDTSSKTKKAGVEVSEKRDTNDSHHISRLLVAILGGLGRVVDVSPTHKRIADDVLWHDAERPWRRSPLWLVIRVALQRALNNKDEYKSLIIFILCKIVGKAVECELNSDLVFTMRAKVARRSYKLSEPPTPAFVYTLVERSVKQASSLLQTRWSAIQAENAILPMWKPSSLDFASSVTLKLPQARVYINSVLARGGTVVHTTFSPDDPYRFEDITDLSEYADEHLKTKFRDQGLHALHDFEESILGYTESWVQKNLENPNACNVIEACFRQYYKLAKTEYTDSPEDKSIMVLILTRLWVALDDIACEQFPLLREYTPDIPITFLEPILLRRSRHISCADTLEQYIAKRCAQADAKHPTVFSDTVTYDSISVRYFRDSSKLQELKGRIEDSACTSRSAKKEELENLNEEHRKLMSRSSGLGHEIYQRRNRWGHEYTEHAYSCEKCRLEKEAAALCIDTHEWPLPTAQLEAERVVFELACPVVFSIWRNITFELLCTIGTPGQVGEGGAIHDLHGSDICQWLEQPSFKQITLAADTKQFAHSHYRSRSIPARESDVLLPHGSRWHLYDRESQTWAFDRFSDTNLSLYGTFSIPVGSPYRYLQDALGLTVHTSNSILARQNECPADITLHEHIAFGSLRSGGRIQWLNIIRELASNDLSFESEEVHLLLLQATFQLGPRSLDQSSSSREWHEPLADPKYVMSLLDTLNALLKGVEANWRQVTTLKTIGELPNQTERHNPFAHVIAAMVVSRVLASQPPSTDNDIARKAYTLLRDARKAAHSWIKKIEQTLEHISDPDEIEECSQRLLTVSATCRSTYDVDMPHLAAVLTTETDLCVFVHCGFILHHHTPARGVNVTADIRRILLRDYRLRHCVHKHKLIVQRIDEGNLGLNQAICAVLDGFSRSNGIAWEPVNRSNWCWWVAQAANQTPVHCNIFDGQFLVNGKTLGRLPNMYMNHDSYQRIFGNVRFLLLSF